MNQKIIKKYYRPQEAAIYLGIGLSTFWRYVKMKKISTQKFTKGVTVIEIKELERFAENQNQMI